jgi:hypothetical protein
MDNVVQLVRVLCLHLFLKSMISNKHDITQNQITAGMIILQYDANQLLFIFHPQLYKGLFASYLFHACEVYTLICHVLSSTREYFLKQVEWILPPFS